MHFRTNKKRAGVRPASCLTVGLNDWKLRKLGGDLKKAFLVQLLLYDVGSHLAPAWTKKLLFYAFLPLMRPRHQVRPTGGSSAATHRAKGIICQNLFKKGTFEISWTKKASTLLFSLSWGPGTKLDQLVAVLQSSTELSGKLSNFVQKRKKEVQSGS